MRIRSEVSELDFSANQNVPGITTRRAETTVELGSGQAFMIAGLTSNRAANSIDKAPGLGDVPILGNLFRSTSFRRGETELVIIVTPYLVKPVNANDIALPTDGYMSPNELERTFGYKMNGDQPYDPRPKPTAVDRNGDNTPGVSRIDPAAVLPTPGQQSGRSADKSNKKSKANERTASAAPGFSLK